MLGSVRPTGAGPLTWAGRAAAAAGAHRPGRDAAVTALRAAAPRAAEEAGAAAHASASEAVTEKQQVRGREW